MAGYNKIRKKKSKGLAVFCVILALLFIAASGVGAWGWVRAIKFEEPLKTLQPSNGDNSAILDNGLVVGEQTGNNSLMSLSVTPRVTGSSVDDMVESTSYYEFEAIVAPIGSEAKDFTYTANWKNASSEWAIGKAVTDYITLTVDEENPLKAKVQSNAPFGEPVIVSCTYDFNAEISVSRQLDYIKQIEEGRIILNPNVTKLDIDGNYELIFELKYGVGTIQGDLENIVAYWQIDSTKIANSQYYQIWYKNTVKDGVHCGTLRNQSSCFIEYTENTDGFYLDVHDYIEWEDRAAYDTLYSREYDKYLTAAFKSIGEVGVDIYVDLSYLYNGVEIDTFSDSIGVTVDFGTLYSSLFDVNGVSWANGGSGSVIFY